MSTPIICPACGKAPIAAYFQSTVRVSPDGRVVPMDYMVDSDSFEEAACLNNNCHVSLMMATGDRRLRKAELSHDVTEDIIEDEALRSNYVLAVETLINLSRENEHNKIISG